MKFLIISGMSGAGKSRAINALEDIGFYCVDNMPLSLISKFVELIGAATEKYQNVALVTDVRAGGDIADIIDQMKSPVSDIGVTPQILFLDAADDVLVNRYKETRRKHPLDDGIGIKAAILKERELVCPVKHHADYVIDTSKLSNQRLREHIVNLFAPEEDDKKIFISVLSFGFKYGVPEESDLVFDVRFLPNPFYIEALRDKTGRDREVYDYVFSFDIAGAFVNKLNDFVDFLIPQYIEEGKTSLVISIGCTGGKHRSVALCEHLSEHLKSQGCRVLASHRDIKRA